MSFSSNPASSSQSPSDFAPTSCANVPLSLAILASELSSVGILVKLVGATIVVGVVDVVVPLVNMQLLVSVSVVGLAFPSPLSPFLPIFFPTQDTLDLRHLTIYLLCPTPSHGKTVPIGASFL